MVEDIITRRIKRAASDRGDTGYQPHVELGEPKDTCANRRTFWTSGKDDIEAANRVGRDKPVCVDAATAHHYAEDGESLFKITIEEFPLDQATLLTSYLHHLDSE